MSQDDKIFYDQEVTKFDWKWYVNFYPDLKKVANVRKMFETKTIFNYMGPTLNPLKAKYQLLGTFNRFSAEILNKILFNINLKKPIII